MVSITWQSVGLGLFIAPSPIVPSLNILKPSIFKLFKLLASFSYAIWSSATFLASWSEPWTYGNFNTLIVSITLQPVGLGLFTAPSKIVPSLHRLKPRNFKIFKPLASVSYATWSSATFLASCSEPWTYGNFNTLIVSITLHPARFGFFTAPSSIIPSLHRQKVCIFTLFTPLALFSYATWSSTIFLASYSEPWIHGSFYYKHVFMPVRFGFFTRTSTIVPLLHRRIACIFKLFTPLASFSYATWSSVTFLASWSQPRISWNFYTPMVYITLQPVGLGLFTASSPIVPSLHRLKPSIFKLFKPLASFSYAIWSSATFLASCSEPWTCGNYNTLIVSITLYTACRIRIIHSSVTDCTFIAPTET